MATEFSSNSGKHNVENRLFWRVTQSVERWPSMHQTLGKHPILLETDARDTLVIPAHGMEKQEDLK